MTGCRDEGQLRAYLDDELTPAAHASITEHLAGCAACRRHMGELRAHAAHLDTLLAAPVPVPDPHCALIRVQSHIGADDEHHDAPVGVSPSSPRSLLRRLTMRDVSRFWAGPYRKIAAVLVAGLLVAGLLAIPPVRAVADQLLQIFRVQQVVYLPISPERLEELENLDFDGESLFVSEPEVLGDPVEPYSVTTVAEAEQAVGYPLYEPATLPAPADSTEITVRDSASVQFQVDVEAARQVLDLLAIDDVTIPDALGEQPIVADAPASAGIVYTGDDYTLALHQSTGPEMSLPEGVDLAQLGKAALRVLGMDEQQAEELSQQIDWSSTLLFPFPSGMDSVSQVTVGDAEGLLVSGEAVGDHAEHRHASAWQLYWQRGDRIYVLVGDGGISRSEMLVAAESVR
jgi:hypothetical protein